jgi:hypothetical protein
MPPKIKLKIPPAGAKPPAPALTPPTGSANAQKDPVPAYTPIELFEGFEEARRDKQRQRLKLLEEAMKLNDETAMAEALDNITTLSGHIHNHTFMRDRQYNQVMTEEEKKPYEHIMEQSKPAIPSGEVIILDDNNNNDLDEQREMKQVMEPLRTKKRARETEQSGTQDEVLNMLRGIENRLGKLESRQGSSASSQASSSYSNKRQKTPANQDFTPHTIPANVNGNIPGLDPTHSLDVRTILWPHVSLELIKSVLDNKLNVTKLHLLIPADYRPSLDTPSWKRKSKYKSDDSDSDAEAKNARKITKLGKQFPTRDIWTAALSVWYGIKSYYDTSNKIFAPSIAIHLTKIAKMCNQYSWDSVLRYETAFFQRYATVTNPAHVWSLVDQQLYAEHLQMNTGSLFTRITSPNKDTRPQNAENSKTANTATSSPVASLIDAHTIERNAMDHMQRLTAP